MPRSRYAQNKNYYVALGRRIKQARESKKAKQDDLALQVSLTRGMIAYSE